MDSFRIVRVAHLRAAVVGPGFDPEHNQLDKIIQSNANFHRESADRVKLNMSKAVCDRLKELGGVSVETAPPVKATEPTTIEPTVVDPVVPATPTQSEPEAVEPKTATAVEPSVEDDAEDAEDDAAE